VVARGEHAAAIAADGLHVDGGWGKWRARVSVVGGDAEAADLLVLATKAHDSAAALPEWAGHDGTPVLVLQNGLGGEQAVRDALPNSPVAVGLALFAVSLTGPGRITVTGPNGLTLGGEDDAVAVTEPVLRHALPAELTVTDDIRGAQFTKLLINQVNALPAITGLSVQQTIADDRLRRVLTSGWSKPSLSATPRASRGARSGA